MNQLTPDSGIKQEEDLKQPLYLETHNQTQYINYLINENHYLRKQLRLQNDFRLQVLTEDGLREQIFNIVDYLMRNLNQIPEEQIFLYQKQIVSCTQKRVLKYIFFCIFTRYLKATKTKEEMIKFIIRKCMKELRIKEPQFEWEDFDNKKMNATYITQLFKNPFFQDEYQRFLNHYLDLALEENKIKIIKYVNYILQIVQQEKFQVDQLIYEQIHSYKRFPWLVCWINESVQISQQLPNMKKSK